MNEVVLMMWPSQAKPSSLSPRAASLWLRPRLWELFTSCGQKPLLRASHRDQLVITESTSYCWEHIFSQLIRRIVIKGFMRIDPRRSTHLWSFDRLGFFPPRCDVYLVRFPNPLAVGRWDVYHPAAQRDWGWGHSMRHHLQQHDHAHTTVLLSMKERSFFFGPTCFGEILCWKLWLGKDFPKL